MWSRCGTGTGFQSVKEKFFTFMARLMCHKAKQKWNILAVQKGVGYKRHIGIHFAPDAAATEKTAKCPLYFTPETDGLSQSWNVGGSVFCNPPYGREIGKWVQKAWAEYQRGEKIPLCY